MNDQHPPGRESRFAIHHVPTLTHGRVLVREALAARRRGILVGFHGYAETAGDQMTRLEHLPGSAAWTLVSVQALHRFYRGRTPAVVASWMTHEDRELAIADNLAYVSAALADVPHDEQTIVVYAGFSQGVAMAFRAAVRGGAAGVVGVGGDVPPELWDDASAAFPPTFFARGDQDEWFKADQFASDATRLRARGVKLTAFTHPGGHVWDTAVAEAAGHFLQAL